MSALLGKEPTDVDLAWICDWIEEGTYYICPEGMLALARGIRRLLAEKQTHPAPAEDGDNHRKETEPSVPSP